MNNGELQQTHKIRSSHDAVAPTQELVLGRGSNRKLYERGDSSQRGAGGDFESDYDAVQPDEYSDADALGG